MSKPLVGIEMSNDSAFSIRKEVSKILEKFKITHEVLVTSVQWMTNL